MIVETSPSTGIVSNDTLQALAHSGLHTIFDHHHQAECCGITLLGFAHYSTEQNLPILQKWSLGIRKGESPKI